MYDDHVFCNDALNEIKFHLSSIFRAREFIDRFSKSADMAHILKLSKESMEISKSLFVKHPPEGPPVCTALKRFPFLIPPPIS